jgi:hypothetical protein
MFQKHGNAMVFVRYSSQLHSIADFIKDNPTALKKLFKLFVSFLKEADLISGETISIDDFLEVAKTQFLVKTNLCVRQLLFKSERKYETKPKILLKKKRTLNPLEILSKLYDNCIFPTSDRFRSTGVSWFVLRTKRNSSC